MAGGARSACSTSRAGRRTVNRGGSAPGRRLSLGELSPRARCACRPYCMPTKRCSTTWTTRCAGNSATSRACRGSWARPARCPTRTGATAPDRWGGGVRRGRGGVVSAGGVGFDISCGVRTLVSTCTREQVVDVQQQLAHELSRAIPAGVGSTGRLRLSDEAMMKCSPAAHAGRSPRATVRWTTSSTSRSAAAIAGADPRALSKRARERQREEMGTLVPATTTSRCSGWPRCFDRDAAAAFGLESGACRGEHPLRLAGPRAPGGHRLPARHGDRCAVARTAPARSRTRLRADPLHPRSTFYSAPCVRR